MQDGKAGIAFRVVRPTTADQLGFLSHRTGEQNLDLWDARLSERGLDNQSLSSDQDLVSLVIKADQGASVPDFRADQLEIDREPSLTTNGHAVQAKNQTSLVDGIELRTVADVAVYAHAPS